MKTIVLKHASVSKHSKAMSACYEIKEKGDLDFIIETLQSDEVGKYWTQKWYPEAYYLLSAIDYLCRVNDLPICTNYEEIRGTSLKKTIYRTEPGNRYQRTGKS